MFLRKLKVLYTNNLKKYSTKLAQELKPNQKLITCKKQIFNLHINDKINETAKFGSIPLATKGWRHNKSKGDYLIFHPVVNNLNNQLHESFEQLNVSSVITEYLLQKYNIRNSTFIQSIAIPKIITGNHTLIAAETGCGKTYSYLIPVLEQLAEKKKIIHKRNFNTPLGLILTPGRELATQIGTVAEEIGNLLNIKVKVILGGNTKQQMFNPSFDDVDLVVASIGAMSKLVTTGIYRMNEVRHVVLDEADTLLDDSFNPKLVYFMRRFGFSKNHLQDLNENIVGTQLIMASATMPTNIDELLEQIIDTNTLVEVVSPNLHKIMDHVSQKFLRMSKSERPASLLNLVKTEVKKKHPVIIFSNKAATSDFISIFLNDNGIETINLNGDMLMKIRIGRFNKFQEGEVNVLSTTDIGSRGLDTKRVRHVINFDFPIHVADYIHRCGRIGRVGSAPNSMITNYISSQGEIELVQKIEHAARTQTSLTNVNGNITSIIKNRILKTIQQESSNNLK